MVTVRCFERDACPSALFRFRYDIYVDEIGWLAGDVDHEARELRDPLDGRASHYIAYEGDEIVGAMRVNNSTEGVGPYHEFYELGRLSAAEFAVSTITTRLMISKEARRQFVGLILFQEAIKAEMAKGMALTFMDCNARQVASYERLGCEFLFEKIHDVFGRVSVMKLRVDDVEHLTKVRSPFLSIAKRALAVRADNQRAMRNAERAKSV